MRYLLDTNICIYLSKRNHPGLRAKLALNCVIPNGRQR